MSKIITFLTLFLIHSSAEASGPVLSIRFDPGYLYSPEYAQLGNSWDVKGRAALQDALISHWKRMAVSRVYILFLNPVYGWNLPIQSTHLEIEQGLGKTQFLKELSEKMLQAGIEPWAWFYFLQSKQVWQNEPAWRQIFIQEKNSELYLLKPKVSQAWMREVMDRLAKEVPAIRGVDFAEPHALDLLSRKELTSSLLDSMKKAKSLGWEISITPLIQLDSKGNLLSEAKIQKLIGLDWNLVLQEFPNVLFSPQLQFQEWKQGPGWCRRIYKELRKRFGARPKLGVHLEFSSFSSEIPHVSPSQLAAAIYDLSQEKNLAGIDLYDSHLAWRIFGAPNITKSEDQNSAAKAASARNSP